MLLPLPYMPDQGAWGTPKITLFDNTIWHFHDVHEKIIDCRVVVFGSIHGILT